uniref:Uncharacterized protein n=1 Tax=Tetraselmis sp. GSL018 TaxID=582737 RepID=A0A061QWV1_9CHLO
MGLMGAVQVPMRDAAGVGGSWDSANMWGR